MAVLLRRAILVVHPVRSRAASPVAQSRQARAAVIPVHVPVSQVVLRGQGVVVTSLRALVLVESRKVRARVSRHQPLAESRARRVMRVHRHRRVVMIGSRVGLRRMNRVLVWWVAVAVVAVDKAHGNGARCAPMLLMCPT